MTGAASGIGRATAECFRRAGDHVIGVDVRDVEVVADLSTVDGRATMRAEVERLAPQGIDTIIASAGIATGSPELIVAVNYFGALATLEGLRPQLAKSSRPRAVAVVSTAALPGLLPVDAALVEACLAGDETIALAAARSKGDAVYPSSKRALALWVRRAAVQGEWAPSGILLNAVAPGAVVTPMTAPLLATEQGRAMLLRTTPIAVNQYGRPEEIAEILTFFGRLDGSYMVGQIVCVDGGTDALSRPSTF